MIIINKTNNNNPQVLLIYPGEIISMYFTYRMPLALLYIAQSLKKVGIEVSIFDMRKDKLKDLIFKKYLFVGITMMTGNMITRGLKIAKLIKEYNHQIPIVLGGVHPSLLPEQTLKNDLVDYVIIGEGEITGQELSLCLLNKGDISKVKGIGYKDLNGNVKINPNREFINMDDLDIALPYESLGVDFYKSDEFPIHTSRGCPYRCTFCYNTSYNKRKYRYKSALKCIEEIEYIQNKFNINKFNFGWEDEFFIDTKRVQDICENIIKKDLKIKWSAFCRFNTFDNTDNEFVKVLKKSGCEFLLFGAESGSQRILDEVIKKDINIDQILRGVERLKKADLSHLVSFMCCLPKETEDDLNATSNLIDKISQNNPKLFINGIYVFCPIPGTPLYEMVIKDYNFIPPDSLEDWGKYEMPNLPLSCITWQSKNYVKRCKSLYLSSTYPFYNASLTSYKAYRNYLAGTVTGYLPLRLYYFMARIQRLRWINKYYKYPLDHFIFEIINKYIPFFKKWKHLLTGILARLKVFK